MTRNHHLDDFMNHHRHTALTFDDVTLVTQYADFLPGEADTSSRFTRNVSLQLPLVSAAMDTVTEADMAIAMAMMGGIGVVHKNLSPAEQAHIVRRVKHHLNGLIEEPVTFHVGDTLRQVKAAREAKRYAFSGFPILDQDEKLAGILTGTDMKFAQHDGIRVEQIMTHPVVTAPKGTTIEQAYEIMLREKTGKLPLVDHGRLVGLYSFTDVATLLGNVKPMYNRDPQHRLRVAAAVSPGDEDRVERLAREGTDVLVIDTAHGHSRGVLDSVRAIKQAYPGIDVVAGNIADGEAALALLEAGADAVKVGVGPGSICTTRVVAGVGIPQITAIYRCAQALDDAIPIIADGGIRHSGDVVKALAAGAHSVMAGALLAGTEESPGEKIIYQGRQYVLYRGMGSLDAIKTREGSRTRYGLTEARDDDLVPQGIEGMVPYAGSVTRVIKQFQGGLQAGMGYCGCRTIEALRQRARLMRVTHSGVVEAHPHDVKITKEAPNYRS